MFRLPPWKHQLELDLCYCAMSQRGILSECGVCREPGGDPLGHWSCCCCRGASVPPVTVWAGVSVTPGVAPEGSDRKVLLTSGKCEDTGTERQADRYAVLRVAVFLFCSVSLLSSVFHFPGSCRWHVPKIRALYLGCLPLGEWRSLRSFLLFPRLEIAASPAFIPKMQLSYTYIMQQVTLFSV